MGGRGGDFMTAGARIGVTEAQERTINRLIKRTRDLKNEQSRIVGEDGSILVEKKGTRHEVAMTVGEKRNNMPGAVAIHNHPDGGTFSQPDLRDFGYGARELVVATPEGTYRLVNTKYGTREQYEGWYAMSEALDSEGLTQERSYIDIRDQARSVPAVSRLMQSMSDVAKQWVDARQSGASQSVLDKLSQKYNDMDSRYKDLLHTEMRKAEVDPYHKFYQQNARKYGFDYSFTRRK